MSQIARNLTFAGDGFLSNCRFLICDRDGKFFPAFKRLRSDAGVNIVLTPYRAPNATEYLAHYHRAA